jgi:hypothetical protein
MCLRDKYFCGHLTWPKCVTFQECFDLGPEQVEVTRCHITTCVCQKFENVLDRGRAV